LPRAKGAKASRGSRASQPGRYVRVEGVQLVHGVEYLNQAVQHLLLGGDPSAAELSSLEFIPKTCIQHPRVAGGLGDRHVMLTSWVRSFTQTCDAHVKEQKEDDPTGVEGKRRGYPSTTIVASSEARERASTSRPVSRDVVVLRSSSKEGASQVCTISRHPGSGSPGYERMQPWTISAKPTSLPPTVIVIRSVFSSTRSIWLICDEPP